MSWIHAHKAFSIFVALLPWSGCLLLALLPLLRSAAWTYRQNREHRERIDGELKDAKDTHKNYWRACWTVDDMFPKTRSLLDHARGYFRLIPRLFYDYRQRIRRREGECAQYRRPWLKPLVLATVIGLLATVGANALTLHTDCGFVTVAPTADPAGSELTLDTYARAQKDTAPAGITRVTEIWWYCSNATEESNYDVGIYSDAGAGEPELRLHVSANNAKGTTGGWKGVTGLNLTGFVAGTVYWIAVELDNTATATLIDAAGSGGVGISRISNTSLPADWGTGSNSATSNLAICAVYETETGGTVYAESCSQADVLAAYNACYPEGTVVLPAGTETWMTTSAGDPEIEVTKSITFIGQGDTTIINVATDNGWLEVPFYVHDVASFRMSKIKFTGTTGSFGAVYIDSVPSFRFDYLTCPALTGSSLVIESSYGVVDHCYFSSPAGRAILVGADNVWHTATPWGSADTVFIEDCTFVYGGAYETAVNTEKAGSYVFRYNTVTGAGVQNHGLATAPPMRGGRLMEVYHNTFIAEAPSSFSCVYLYGGTGVVYSNTFTGTWNSPLNLAHLRAEVYDVDLYHIDWGRCDGTAPIDGNTEDMMGYPGRDQIGRSQDEFEWAATTPFAGPYPTQALDPVYQWDNESETFAIGDGGSTSPAQTDHIVAERDYYDNTEKPDYTAYTYPHPLTITSGFNTRLMLIINGMVMFLGGLIGVPLFVRDLVRTIRGG